MKRIVVVVLAAILTACMPMDWSDSGSSAGGSAFNWQDEPYRYNP